MKRLLLLSILFASFSFISCKDKKEELKSQVLPQITQAYQSRDWDTIILLVDSLRNNGILDSEYNQNQVNIPYCEALIATGHPEKAVAEIKEHISKRNPHDLYAYQTLGVAYSAMNDTANAIEAYNRAIEIQPSYVRPYIHLAYLYKGTDAEKSIDNYSKAIQVFGNNEAYDEVLQFGYEACEVDSTNTIILKYMGDAYFARKDLDSAKAFYSRVLSDAGNNGSAVPQVLFESTYQLALIHYLEGHYKQASQLLEVIYYNADGFPKTPKSVLFGAYILGAAVAHKMGDQIVSQKLMDLANEIDPDVAAEHYNYFLSLK